MNDVLGQLLRRTPEFRGKPRLVGLWRRRRRTGDHRVRELEGGGTIVCDVGIPYEAMIWLAREEEAELEVARRRLRAGDVFADCGANIGLWTVTAASAVGAGGSVIAFEPDPRTRRRLLENLEGSDLQNVEVHAEAVGATAGSGQLALANEHNVSRLVDLQLPGDVVTVDVVTLDQIVGGRRLAGCKIDVEGAELGVLQGATRTLERSHPWLIVEFNTELTGNRVLSKWDVDIFLKALGYEAHAIDGTRLPEGWVTDGYRNLLYLHLRDA
jgi:FkbM family methyltransferase